MRISDFEFLKDTINEFLCKHLGFESVYALVRAKETNAGYSYFQFIDPKDDEDCEKTHIAVKELVNDKDEMDRVKSVTAHYFTNDNGKKYYTTITTEKFNGSLMAVGNPDNGIIFVYAGSSITIFGRCFRFLKSDDELIRYLEFLLDDMFGFNIIDPETHPGLYNIKED